MYNKLFTKILDSSIWLESDGTRIVWMTLLAAMDQDGFAQFASVPKFRKNVGGQTNWNAIRAVVLADGPQCVYCEIAVATEVDHIVPLSKGGTNEFENLVPACRPCNTKKSNGSVMPRNVASRSEIQSDADTDADTDKNPPTPLAGGRFKKPTREERKTAERLIAHSFGCTHQPRCANHEACVLLVVHGLRERAS